MKKGIFIFTMFVCMSLSAQQIELKDITAQKYAGKGVDETISSADGEYYFQANKDKSMIIKYAYKTASPVDTVFNVKRARECDFNAFEGFLISPDEKRLLVYRDSEQLYRHSFKAKYYYYDIRRNLVRKLTENSDKQQIPVFSKDGRMLAYVANNNIWLAKFDYDTESQITRDGQAGSIINGSTDWVYEEEFGITGLIDFSDDSKLLAFVRFDETAVPEFSFQYYGNELYPKFKSFKYPKAGLPNSKVTCQVFDIESKTTRAMNVPMERAEYIPRIQFVNDSQLAVMTLNREQNDFNMYYLNPRSSVSRLILHEESDRYIDVNLIASVNFLADQFVYLSEKDGYSHIYSYSHSGVQQKQLTSGNYDVTQILAVNPDSKTVFYESAEESPLRRSVYKTDLVKGTKTKISAKQGYNSATFGNKGKYFVNIWSDAKTPAIVTLNDANGKELKVLEDNQALKATLNALNLPQKEFITLNAKDGTALNAWLLKPANFNASTQYPLVMVQYNGPGSQEVLDKFSVDWTACLVTQGFVVACVDGRGTGARGQDFKKCTYLNLGLKESDDQIEAATYFGTLPYIDKNRMAIWGWSYGGYNVLMSMSRGNVFRAGVAIAPVTDWRFYDSAYTERFMRTPQQNDAGYTAGSPVALANKLSGSLLLIHGSADDNVHFQNTIEYANALIEADKQFDMFVFPDKNHAISGTQNRTFLYRKVIDFFKKNL
ncbi:S9 family peptidase [Viscerimonas tarda]